MTNKDRDAKATNHEGRIRTLEKWMWGLTGAISYGLLDNIPLLREATEKGISMLPHIDSVLAFSK